MKCSYKDKKNTQQDNSEHNLDPPAKKETNLLSKVPSFSTDVHLSSRRCKKGVEKGPMASQNTNRDAEIKSLSKVHKRRMRLTIRVSSKEFSKEKR